MHKRRYVANDPGGARKVSGRYNLGLDQFPDERAFGALYLALAPETCLGEILRHVTPLSLSALNDYLLSELYVEAPRIVDCRDPDRLGLTLNDLEADFDLAATRSLGAAAFAAGMDGLLTVSATRLGNNLVLFPENMGSRSRLEVRTARDPRLYVDRHA